MPCPYFFPNLPLAETGWFRPPRAPLVLLHGGQCRAGTGSTPEDYMLCNFGYARGTCACFPADAPFDAVRFSAIREDTPGMTRLIYVLERAHAPAVHGMLIFYVAENRLEGAEGSGALEAQARAYLAAVDAGNVPS